MRLRLINSIIFLFINVTAFGQNNIDVKAVFDVKSKQIKISQTIEYFNASQDTLNVIYLNDWSNSYSTKKTPLAIRFAEEYKTDFHFAKNEERGYSVITSIVQDEQKVIFKYLKEHPDVIEVNLKSALNPNASYIIKLNYIVQVPSDKFTRYGVSENGDFNLRYWYITPTVYNGEWQYFSNKNLDDLFIPKSDIEFHIEFPKNYTLISELDVLDTNEDSQTKTITLEGKNRVNSKLILTKQSDFKTVQTDFFSVISNLSEKDLQPKDKAVITDRIAGYITNNLGDYPHKNLLITAIDDKKDPVYGLNQLPSFIRPFPNNFHFELKLLKASLNNYLENTLLINPRKDQWLKDGLQIYFLMKYIEQYYPDMKLLGTFANFWAIRGFHASDLNFNAQYNLAYMHMARTNRDQPLKMQKDSLLKFNKNIANKYKAGVGLKYLDDFINSSILETSIKSFLSENKFKQVQTKDFENHLKSKTEKDINWFFTDFLNTREKIDFKIQNVKKTEDSITLTIKNKRNNNMPISLFSLNNDSVISKTWIENIGNQKTVVIPKNEANKLVLNYDNTIPEYNLRDNWKSLKGFFFNNKPLQFRLFKDIEDPNYNQVFLIPLVEFNNIYDGLTLGIRAYNKTVLRKSFNYKFAPQYATKSKSFTGSGTVFNIHNIENRNLFKITYGINASYRSYAEDLFVRKITPSLSFAFRDKNDLRSNKIKALKFRYLDIQRDEDVNNISNTNEPDYKVFNAQYVHSNDNLINFSKWFTDFQLSKQFGKLAFNFEYRKLFESNRQLNLRFYSGTFLYNRTDANSDYFSFALDRPTDYLFDYNYLGRSEASGIFSQQLIIAEGGFKSQLQTPFANQWITTLNASTTLWKYIQAYGDVGFVKNKFSNPEFVYDAGIRLNLVTDYFEVYFPMYSNLGWEVGQPNYDQKIRFIFTVDPQALLGLFRRKWY